jgi:hypothetical protein
MSSTAQGIPLQFNASVDVNEFFVPVSTGITGPTFNPLTAFQIKTVPQKSLLFNITGSVSGFNAGFGGATSTSGSVQLLKSPNPQPTRNFIKETDYTVLGSGVFIKQLGASITDGSGQFDFSATGSVEFNDLLYLRVIGFTGTIPRNPTSFTASLNSFRITSTPTGSAKELVVEPYLTSPFYGTDCDVTYGNASQPVSNPFLQDIDYSNGSIIPLNNQAILSGSATKGTTPESFFTMKSIINPTYTSENITSRYNVDASSFTSQTSGGTFVAYYNASITSGTVSSGFTTRFFLNYLITPDEEAIEITNDDSTLNLLKNNFGTNANPFPEDMDYPFGSPEGEVRIRATTISGSTGTAPLEYRGNIKVLINGTTIVIDAKTSGSASPGSNNFSGGVVYPASIELTSHSDLPNKSREILTENNIIEPSS